jgi:HEPN domain-containing protein
MPVTKYVEQWLARADEDLETARLLIKDSGPVRIACFHAQQAVEKQLKGYLASRERHIRKTHDLLTLLIACKETDDSFSQLEDAVNFLDQFYTDTRYPADAREFTLKETGQALEAALRVKAFVRERLEKTV